MLVMRLVLARLRCCLQARIGLFSFRVDCAECGPDEERREAGGMAVLLAAIKACSCGSTRELEIGKKIHLDSVHSGDYSSIYVANSLINMYAKCGSLADALAVFHAMNDRNVVSWNALVLACALNGEGDQALAAIQQMQQMQGLQPNGRTYVAGLKACSNLGEDEEAREVDGKLLRLGSLENGMALHSQAVKSRCDSDIFVGNALIDMYSKCGSLMDARLAFEKMPLLDVVSWTALIMGYVENGEEDLGLELLAGMFSEGCLPNARTYVAALTACASLAEKEEQRSVHRTLVKLKHLQKGMELHSRAVNSGCHWDMFVASSLVNLYAKCGSLLDARIVFDRMQSHDVVTCTALVLGYAENDEAEIALSLFSQLQQSEVCNSRTFVAVLMACSGLAVKEDGDYAEGRIIKALCLEKGMILHVDALKKGYECEVFVANALMDMYLKCGSLMDARRVFDRIPFHDVVSWSTLIHGYAEKGEAELALAVFSSMISEEGCCSPTARTFVSALVACASLVSSSSSLTTEGKAEGRDTRARCLETGLAIHSLAAEYGYDSDIFVANTLIDLYVKCASLGNARNVFDNMVVTDAVSWNALILGYAENGENEQAFELFQLMLKLRKCHPSARTFVAAFQACAALTEKEEPKHDKLLKVRCLEEGMRIHAEAADRGGFDSSDIFVASALINMYGKCGSLLDARRVFDRMEFHDVVSLTALLLAYVENGESQVGLEFFACMEELLLIRPNSRTFAAAIMACGSLAELQIGKQLHATVCRWGLEEDVLITNCLVDFYGKCSSMIEAEQVFGHTSSTKDPVMWSALVAGYARQGDADRVFGGLQMMVESKVEVNGITFLSVLTACSHSGVVEKGKRCFEEMRAGHGIEPGIEHYHCLIDMLGRGNRLDEALEVIERMPHEPNVVTWTTVLGAAGKWSNVIVGRIAYQALMKLDGNQPAAYMLMANLQTRSVSRPPLSDGTSPG